MEKWYKHLKKTKFGIDIRMTYHYSFCLKIVKQLQNKSLKKNILGSPLQLLSDKFQ